MLDSEKFLFSRDFSSLYSWNDFWLLLKKFANKHIINHKFWFMTDLIIHTVHDWPDGLNGILGRDPSAEGTDRKGAFYQDKTSLSN